MREIPEFPGYFVDTEGNVRGLKGRILAPTCDKDGYLKVNLIREGKMKTMRNHRLVLLAYRGNPPEGKPQARHLDGNQKNNNLENLQWGSYQENADDKIRHGTSRHNIAKSRFKPSDLLKIKALKKEGYTYKAIASEFNTCQSQIFYIVKGTYWSHIQTNTQGEING
jgi:hypothetical protein